MHFSGRLRRTVTVVALLAAGLAVAAPAQATDDRGGKGKGEPGSFTGYAFDACTAPAQEIMDAWRLESPYAGIGIYLGGSNRLCDQPELDADWVSTQQRQGWHLLPLWVGPQASCTT